MEKGCPVTSNNCERAKDAQQENDLKPNTTKQQPQAQPTAEQPPQPKPSTSQVRLVNCVVRVAKGAKGFPNRNGNNSVTVQVTGSMSKLREDVEDCVSSNSQHGFAVVLDDESSTETGVLETFEISSSNSLPNCTTGASAASTVGVGLGHGVNVGVVVPVDDSSSTDTLNGNEDNVRTADSAASEDHSRSASSMNNVFFNDNDNEPPVVCLINDEDNFDEEEIVEEDEDDDEDVVEQSTPVDCPNTSQLNVGKSGSASENIIMTADGSKIFLETPVVDEPQSHTHTLTHTHSNSSSSSSTSVTVAEPGKPKRLSDEFESEARADEEQDEQEVEVATSRGVKSEPGCDVASTSLHDRQMSVRLKQMSLTANAEASSSGPSQSQPQSFSKADIESMDRIERRDFETEQRLTGGIILGTSSLISKNRLNLSLINPAAAAAAKGAAAGGNDDWPSSSNNGRAFSSDSKVS